MIISNLTKKIPLKMIPTTFVKLMSAVSAPHPDYTGYMLVARGHNAAKQTKVMVWILSVASIIFFTSLMLVSVHRSVMAAREERLEGHEIHRTGNVFLKLARWIWGGFVFLFCAFLNIFTMSFWKQSWADLKFLLSPYSWLGVWVNAYTCGHICNADPDYDPELAGFIKAKTEAKEIVSQEPKPHRFVTVTETPALQPPAPAIVKET